MTSLRSWPLVVATLAACLCCVTAQADTAGLTLDRVIAQDGEGAPLKTPEGVGCSDGGPLAIADTGNGRLLLFVFQGGTLQGGAVVKHPQMTYPTSVQIDSKGNLVVLDRKTRKLLRLDSKGAMLGPVEIRASDARASVVPTAFDLDASDAFYVLDAVAGRVVVADAAGVAIRQVPLPKGKAAFEDVYVDNAGTIYVVEGLTATVWAAGKSDQAFKAIGPGLKDRISFPTRITGSRGRLTLTDHNGHGLVLLGTDGSFQGRQLSLGANEGLVNYPSQVCIDGLGNVFVADTGNSRVQVFSSNK
jgi:hypothetical protein